MYLLLFYSENVFRFDATAVIIPLAVAGVGATAYASEVVVPVNIMKYSAAVFVPVEATVMVVCMMVLVDPVVIVDVDGTVTGSRS
jgi:hypothetical protein